jgi:transposase
LSQKRITPKTTKEPAQYILSEQEKTTATKYADLLQSKDPVKNSINIMEKIASQDEEVGKFLKENNGIFSKGELKNYILEKIDDVSDVTVDQNRINTLKKTLVENFSENLDKNDIESLWKARKEFDSTIEKAFTGSPTLQNTIKKEFRNAVQDYIADRTPEGVYKEYMRDMRSLYNLHETVATKASKEKGINAIQLWIKNNPNKAKAIGWGTGLIGAQQAYELLK